MITPIRTLTINQIIARQDDLLVSVEDVKEVAQHAKEELLNEISPLFEDVITMDNICEVLDGEWCEKHCGETDKCLARYLEWLKEQKK